MNKNKETIIFSVSHLYLFWSTGVFYIWELAKMYNVVIVAEESFKYDDDFLTICKLINISDIVYLPLIRNILLRHLLYSRKLKTLAYKICPDIVLQHNHYFPQNIYLFYWAKEANDKCVRGVYLNGQLRKTDSDIVTEELRNAYVEGLISGFTHMKKVLKSFARYLSWAKKMANNYIFPKIFTGDKLLLLKYLKRTKTFVPPKEYNYPSTQLVDFYLTYYPIEKKICEEQFDNVKVFQISHPMETSDGSCFTALSQIKGYELGDEDIVLILPSYLGFYDTPLEQKNLSNWITAIKLLEQKFPAYHIILKLHPRTHSNPISQKVAKKIISEIPAITILEPKENAEKWIMKSKVIVGDVSTTLWWANYFHSKIVISFDMHDFTGSDDMKYYEGIYYFNSLEEFKKFELSSIIKDNRWHYKQKRKVLSSLSEVIEDYNELYGKSLFKNLFWEANR